MSVNKAILLGNVGKDPEVKIFGTDTKVATFSLATSETYKNKSGEKVTDTTWHNIVVWRGLAEVVERYVRKGSQLFVEGKITNEKYTDKNGIERFTTKIVADNIRLLGGKPEHQQSKPAETHNAAIAEASMEDYADENNLPF